ncbi:hypothetical protein RIF29_05268 [Crotalaria pallida]|uniref:Sodium/calcium exchanger membrane region domain-containing protein n=1 Tax=Crotalaria pallida TaxID=3830 RepID=A0AAN9J222_CROPI
MGSVSKHMGFTFTLLFNTSFLVVLCGCAFVIFHFHYSENGADDVVRKSHFAFGGSSEQGCKGLHSLSDYKAKCFYVKSNDPCVSQGYVDYLYLFYCKFGEFPLLGHTLLFLWLLVLFYLLANTASEYFCPSLESLSSLLRLSPTIAGVTLLSLGNGASDVFATLVSFNSSSGTRGSGIGFNTVLGGASFVSCVVVGIVSISIRSREIRIKKSAFIRDVCFLLLVLLCLFIILVSGEINVLEAIGFCLMYVVYVAVVYVSSTRWKGVCGDAETDGDSSHGSDLGVPLLAEMEKGLIGSAENGAQECEKKIKKNNCCKKSSISGMLLHAIEMPLYLPRRLTIPVVCEERWSKLYAVSSAMLAPVLLSLLCTPNKEKVFCISNLIIYGIGFLVGIILCVVAFFTTKTSTPPKKYLLPWLAGGFVMSVTWSYISAKELVVLLASIGYICGVSPSILGLTVLAWGNSLGDLVTNLTMALNGGPEGAQIAISGCYAGPIFNTVIGLGLSLVTTTWSQYPSSVMIPRDPYLWETLALLVVGLVWALVILIRRDMKLDAVLGGGLLVVYFISLFLRLIQTLGTLQLQDILTLVFKK